MPQPVEIEMKMSLAMSFDPDFADPTEWARMYRSFGLQVVPAMSPKENKNQWKRPALPKWRELEHALAPDFTFERWYGEEGEHARRNNMGLIAGACSSGVFVVDLDLHKDQRAQAWWYEVLDLQQSAGELETVEQATGGGGVQLFFRAPIGWVPPTCKTSIGVDIRGQGGFAMMPPSMHESGKAYRWKSGHEPWEMDIASAPQWFCEQITQLAVQYGGASGENRVTGESVKTSSPPTAVDSFGFIIDGREDYMTKLIWAAVVDLRRECPGDLGPLSQVHMMEAFNTYERKVKSRLHGLDSNAERLEREGRGISMFTSKWDNAIEQWDGKVAQHAAVERPSRPFEDKPEPLPFYKVDPETGELTVEAKKPDAGIFEFLDIEGIRALPKPKYLIDKLMIESGLGFVYGPPGCGKSFLTIGMGLSIASRCADWFSRSIKKTGPVVYISSEGVGDIGLRIDAWEKETGVEVGRLPFYLIRQTINFMAAPDVEKLLKTVAAISQVAGQTPVVVFVDTVSRVLPGADENLQKDMTLFIGACDAVRVTFDATVVGVHHTSRAGNLRGSTVFDGAGDFLLGIEREEGEMIGQIHARKIKSAEDGWKQAFELKKVVVNDITGETSLYAKASNEQAKPKEVWPEKSVCRSVLNVIRTAWFAGKPLSSYPQTRKQGRYAQAIISKQFDLPEKVADMMIDTWLSNQVLSYEVADKNTKMQGLKVIGSID
jgi:AAA domain/Bifunctional DNA primase/polymerase, N-terminal